MPSIQQQQQQISNAKKDNAVNKDVLRSNSGSGTIPSVAQSVSGIKTPQEHPEYIKQALLVIEKKVRNLEKRRLRLEEYKGAQAKGSVLNEDQLLAVSKYDEVRSGLDLIKDLDKQLIGLANDAMKAQKKLAKKEQQEREELVKEKLKEVQKYQTVLNTFGDNKIRQDFLEGKYGIETITKEELDLLDEFDNLTQNTQLSRTYENDVNDVVDHYLNLMEAKNKPILSTTYLELKKLFDKILQSPYWTVDPEQLQQQQQQQQQDEPEKIQQDEQKISNVNISSDEFVATSNNETNSAQFDDSENSKDESTESPQQQLPLTQENLKVHTAHINQVNTNLLQQQQQPQHHHDEHTFFTTLNTPDNLMQEFLNNDNNSDRINFLQDSQIEKDQPLTTSSDNNNIITNSSNQFNTQSQQHGDTNQQQQQQPPPQQRQSSNNQFEHENNQVNNQNNNNSYGFGKNFNRNENSYHQRNPDNVGSNYRRQFNSENNDNRRGGGSRGGYSGNRGGSGGGSRGFYRGGSNTANRGGNFGGYRGKPRNPTQQGGYRGSNQVSQHFEETNAN